MNSEDKYRKLLIITGFNLSDNTATDITLRSIFEEWPKTKLLILTFTKSEKPFAPTQIIQENLFYKIRRFSQHLLLTKNTSNNRNLVPGSIIRDKKNTLNIKQKIFAIGAAYADLFYIYPLNEVDTVIKEFNPDAIYSILGSIRIIRFVNKCSKRYRVPIIPHFMDDWISTLYTGSIWLMYPRRVLLKHLYYLLNFSNFGFCISPKMCEEYKLKFKIDFYPLMHLIDSRRIKFSSGHNQQKEVTFCYLGGLHLNRWKSLKTLSEVLEDIQLSVSRKMKIKIFTSSSDVEKYSSEFIANNVEFNSFVDQKSAYEIMQKVDYLIHVESFEDAIIQYTRLSISTKIPEYLASGTPIIAIGPVNVASMEYLHQYGCAYISNTLDKKELMKTLLSAITGDNKSIIVDNGLKLVKNKHCKKLSDIMEEIFVS
jgi:glycosyltransferase involved in cell wall biosynthesis